MLGFISLMIQNCKEPRKYKVGAWESETPCHNITFFIFKATLLRPVELEAFIIK